MAKVKLPTALQENLLLFKWEFVTTWMLVFIAQNGGGFGGQTFAVSTAVLWLLSDEQADLNMMVTVAKMFITCERPVPEGLVRIGGQFVGGVVAALINLIFAGGAKGPIVAGNAFWIFLSEGGATAIFLLVFFHTQAQSEGKEMKAFMYLLSLLAVPAVAPA